MPPLLYLYLPEVYLRFHLPPFASPSTGYPTLHESALSLYTCRYGVQEDTEYRVTLTVSVPYNSPTRPNLE